MGCGACKNGKAFMPMINNLDGSILKGYSPLVSSYFSAPNDSFLSVKKAIAEHQEQFIEKIEQSMSPNINLSSERSQKSQELNTASREFKKFLIEYSQPNKFLVQKEYKIFVWTSNREFLRKVFPQRVIVERIEIDGNSEDVTFIIYSNSPPIIIDCVLYLLNKIEDFKEIYNLNQKYKYVWTQALISVIDHPNFVEIARTLGISMFKTTAELYSSICTDDLKLYKLLRQVFNKIDTNQKGEIDFNELYNGIKRIQDDVSPDDIKEAILRIDINNTGTISFEEFCFWWKKGRHGALSLSQLAVDWAKQISLNIPETKSLLRNVTQSQLGIEKKSIKKEIVLNVGPKPAKNCEVLFDVGKSSSREKILNEINNKLSLFSKDVWLSIKFTSKVVESLEAYENSLKKYVDSFLDSLFLNLIDGKKIKKAIKYSIKALDSDLLITFSLDLVEQYLEPLNHFLFTLDDLATSPLNDYFSMTFTSSNSFSKLISNGYLLENLGESFEIQAACEVWSKYITILLAQYPLPSGFQIFLYTFLLMSGNVNISFNTLQEFLHSIGPDFIKKLEISNLVPITLAVLLQQLNHKFEEHIEVYIRLSNFGAKLSLKSKDIFLVI
jgi:Ca2+-binding EF-hand superfamily protein